MVNDILQKAQAEFDGAVTHLKEEFARLQLGRASAALVEPLMVDAYGSMQPLKNVASVSLPDAKTIQIQPWDKGILAALEKAIQQSDLSMAPSNDGVVIRLNVPPLTEERRRELTKVVNRLAEEARISVRHARQKAHDTFKEGQKNGEMTEDEQRSGEKRLQEKVDSVNGSIEEMAKKKETDVMTV